MSSDTSAEIKAKKSLQKIFKVIYPKKFSLFTKIESKKDLLEAKKKLNTLIELVSYIGYIYFNLFLNCFFNFIFFNN